MIKPPFVVILGQKGQFCKFLAKMAKTVKIIKKMFGKFFSRLHALTKCKVSEKSNEEFARKSATYARKYRRDSQGLNDQLVEIPKMKLF